MVIKRDGFGTQSPRVKSRWRDLFRCYMQLSPEASVEDYLRSCRDDFSPSKYYRSRLAKRVEASPYFKRMVIVHRCALKVKPDVIRSMSAKRFRESEMFELGEAPWYREVLLDACKRFSLSPAWQDFVESHVLFQEGSAGYALLRSPVVDYRTSRETGLVMIALAIDVYVDMSEVRGPISPIVAEAQKALYGVAGSKLRSLGFYELDVRPLYYELAVTYGKSYREIIAMVKRCRRMGMIDPTIRQVYPDKSEEEIAEFLRKLSDFYLTYEGVHSAVRHTRDGFERHYRAPDILAGEF